MCLEEGEENNEIGLVTGRVAKGEPEPGPSEHAVARRV
jgi:hypothetical protein